MARPFVLLVALLLAGTASAEDSLSERINLRVQAYEHSLDPAYAGVVEGLNGWLNDQRRDALNQLHALMAQTTGEQRLFTAFHCLGIDPADAQARDAFTEAKVDAPLDPQGKPSAIFTLTGPVPADLAERVEDLEYPGFERVVQAIDLKSPLVSSYWTKQGTALTELKHDLLGMKDQGEASLIFQLLAFYYPNAKEVTLFYRGAGRPVPTERWWVDHVDQFLIDHELMGRDCLAGKPASGLRAHKNQDGTWTVNPASWVFTTVRSCRVEAVLVPGKAGIPSLTLGEESVHGGVQVTFGAKQSVQLVALPSHKVLGTCRAQTDLTKLTTLELEIRDRHVQVTIGGLPAISGELPRACILRRFSIEGHAVPARSLRLRFISSQGAGVVVKAAQWPEERTHQLEKLLSVGFSDTPVEDALAVISRQCGVHLVLDESGQLLKDLPVTLVAKNMTLASVLDNIARQTDLHASPTAEGLTLSWSK